MSRIVNRLKVWAESRPDKVALRIDGQVITYQSLYEAILSIPFAPQWIQETTLWEQLIKWLAGLKENTYPVIGHRTLPIKAEKELQGVIADSRVESADFGVLTSGTTGLPKVHWRREDSWVDYFPIQNKIFSITEETILFQHGSLSFTGNLNMLLGVLWAGGTIVTTDHMSVKRWLQDCKTYAVSHIYVLPTKMQLILRYSKQEPYPGIQTVIAGSQTPTLAMMRRMRQVFPNMKYILYYGAAELNYISYCTYEEWMEQPGTIGRAFPGVRVEEKEGLLYVTTPYGIEGLSFPFTLGDRGHLEGKLIFFDGRRTDVINRGGFKIDVVAMEQRILAVPGVEQVAVVGVDDDWRGQEPVAFVVGNSLTKPSILHNFQPEERPKDVVFLDELPLTDCSKIDKQSLKKWYNKHMSMTPN